jgi:hypothetical protein
MEIVPHCELQFKVMPILNIRPVIILIITESSRQLKRLLKQYTLKTEIDLFEASIIMANKIN